MQYILENPYTWLFLSSLAGAIALNLLLIKRRHRLKNFWVVGFLTLSITLGYWGVGIVGRTFMGGSTPFWLYYVIIFLFNFIIVRFMQKIYFVVFLVITCMLSLQIALDRWWINLSDDGAVVGIYNYAILQEGLDLAILHEPNVELDDSDLVTYWQYFAPAVNLAFSYASYPKGDVPYDLEGYLLTVPPEFFFIASPSYFYPLSFSTYNSSSNKKKEPPLLVCLNIFFSVSLHNWHKKAPWISEATPVLFYPADFAEK